MFELYILITIILLFLVYLTYLILSTPQQKNRKPLDSALNHSKNHENKINNIVAYHIEKKWIFQNIFLKKSDGKFTEIDVLAVHNTGVYVIECKYMAGKIIGDEDDKSWFQLKSNNACNEFLNPIIQNNIHINACKQILNKYKLPYYSIVVFGNNCTIPNITQYRAKNVFIIRRKECSALINQLTSQQQMYSNQLIDTISELVKVKSTKYIPEI